MRYPLNQIPPLRVVPKDFYPLIHAVGVRLCFPFDVYMLAPDRRRTP